MRPPFITAPFAALLALTSLTALTTSCGESKENAHADWSEARQQQEEKGQTLLADARRALAHKDFATARNQIKTLRRDCAIAFEARGEGILLLDSIDLQEALDGMAAADSLQQSATVPADSARAVLEEYAQRIKFFRRKLEHDRKETRGTE